MRFQLGRFFMAPVITLFLIIFLEGYIVLSTELLAIRLMLPFTGSGTDTVSIIIAAVLMPLAFGYFAGGRFRTKKAEGRRAFAVRDRLIWNLVVAAALLTPGLSHVFLEWAFGWIVHDLHWTNRIVLTCAYSLAFLVVPVFLLGQTVPLVSNYFSRERLSLIAGRILFFSTMGSFMGAVFCTLVLMSFVGVHNTAVITVACMAALAFILAKRKLSPATGLVTLCLGLSLILNSGAAMDRFQVAGNNKYNLIQVRDSQGGQVRELLLNRTFASGVDKYSGEPVLRYAIYIENNFLKPMYDPESPPRDVLVLGAGGFTIGRFDDLNNYIYVDIDEDLKEVAENLLLEEKLGPNKKFVPMEARAYLNQTPDKYDLIILDLYRDPVSAPEYLITREFYRQVRERLKPGGIVLGNYFASPSFSDLYSLRLDNTLRAVFPSINRQVITEYDPWSRNGDWTNIVYSYIDNPGVSDTDAGIYTDDKNPSMFDKPVILNVKSGE